MLSASNIAKYWQVYFSPIFLILSWFGSSILSVNCLFPLLPISMAHFSMLNSIVCIRVFNSFSFFANSLPSVYIRWLIFPAICKSFVHFLSMWLSDIIVITNSNSESVSSWKIPLKIFTSATFFSCSQFHFPFFHGFRVELYDFVGYLLHFWGSIIQFSRNISLVFL